MKRLLAALGCAAGFAGCTINMGQVVTNVTSDGAGGIVVERAEMTYSTWTGRTDLRERTTATIYAGPAPALQPDAEPLE